MNLASLLSLGLLSYVKFFSLLSQSNTSLYLFILFLFSLGNLNHYYSLWLIMVNCVISEILIYFSLHIVINALFNLAYKFRY